jgi:hypothetical protein
MSNRAALEASTQPPPMKNWSGCASVIISGAVAKISLHDLATKLPQAILL